MKTCRVILSELKKVVCNITFIGAVLLSALLCFTSIAYEDKTTGNTYSVLEGLFKLDKDTIMQHPELSNVMLFFNAFSGFTIVFFVIVAAFPFVYYVSNERNTKYTRYIIEKEGIKKYVLGKFLSAFFSGGLVISMGVLLYGAILWLSFPNLSEYSGYIGMDATSSVIGLVISAFLFGGFVTIPSMMMCSFCKNAYLVTCVPFVLFYAWDIAIIKIENGIFLGESKHDIQLIEAFRYNSLLKTNLVNQIDKKALIVLAFTVIIVTIQVGIYAVIVKHKIDKGA